MLLYWLFLLGGLIVLSIGSGLAGEPQRPALTRCYRAPHALVLAGAQSPATAGCLDRAPATDSAGLFDLLQ
jgi:hypothetical protein